jgi:hypothetical protein
MTVGWTLVVAAAALAGPWRRDVLGPFGAICAATLLLLAVDVMAGSRLQLDAPFGLSLLVSGRFYGIGNDALGVYCVSALVAAAWFASVTGGRTYPASRPAHDVFWPLGPQGRRHSGPGNPSDSSIGPMGSRATTDSPVSRGTNTEVALGKPEPEEGARRPDVARPPAVARHPKSSPSGQEVPSSPTGIILGIINSIILRRVGPLAAAAVGLLAVVASGWPGFGAKVGGTIALVPCLILLTAWLAGVRVGRRWAVPVAVSGLVVFLVFAVVSYFLPASGVSDIGTFAGNLLHGRGGDLIQRKVSSNVGSLTLNVFSWLIPVTAALAAAALWRPAVLRLRIREGAFTAVPLLRVLAWLTWLVLVIGWFADDSGVIVPAVALAFTVPLTIGMAAAANISPARDIAMNGSSF